jgi:peptide/nickel transport system substrate-binding protein
VTLSGQMPVSTRRQFLAAGSLGALALAGCGSSQSAGSSGGAPKRGGTLHAVRYEATDGFKLDGQTTNASYQVSQAVMEPLLRANSDARSVDPGLAQSFKYDPKLPAYTLTLAPGARFSDGSPVTTKDVEFSVNLWKSGPNYGPIYKVIKSVESLDARTFRLHLTEPDDDLPAFLTWSAAGIVPANFGGRSANEFWQSPIGAGPFTVSRWQASGTIVFKRNPHYYRQGRPYLDSIVNTLSTEPNQRRLAFISGQADVVDGVNPQDAPGFPSAKLIKSPAHFTDILMFNTKKRPFTDVDARRAVAYAIDYAGISSGVYHGLSEQPTGWLPPNVGLWAPPSKPYFRLDMTTAKQLAAKAGLAGQSSQIIYPPETIPNALAEIVQANMQSLGMHVSLLPTETSTFVGQLFGGKYELAMWGFNAISPDIADPVSFVTSTNFCFTGYPETQLLADLNAYQSTSDVAAKRAAVTRMQNLGEEAAPLLALDHWPVATAAQPNTHGVMPTPWGAYYYDTIWKT